MAGEVHISTRRPDPPIGADFALEIHFSKDRPRPERVFQAADAMIRALQRVDKALCWSIDNNIQPIMMLEEIETGSIRIWLRNVLEAVDDQALKDIDWRPAVGRYLVRAKYAYIRWSNKSEERTLQDLGREIVRLAQDTDVRHLPDYAPPSYGEIAEVTKAIDVAKSHLSIEDRIAYVSADDDEIEFDLTIRWSEEELRDLAISDTTSYDGMPMVLIVKKPDYLGNSKWELRHGKKPISAKIEDEQWLKKFQDRKVDVRPGDGLKCRVSVEMRYGRDHELVSETYTVKQVEDVLENRYKQMDIDDLT